MKFIKYLKNLYESVKEFFSYGGYNPLSKEDEETITKSLGEDILNNFIIEYNSKGIILLPKKKSLEAVVA